MSPTPNSMVTGVSFGSVTLPRAATVKANVAEAVPCRTSETRRNRRQAERAHVRVDLHRRTAPGGRAPNCSSAVR